MELANNMADYVIRNTKSLKVGQQAHVEVAAESGNLHHQQIPGPSARNFDIQMSSETETDTEDETDEVKKRFCSFM
jgi:hypothetical protein